ncbi:MAG: hypothetical protein ACKVQS_11750 [Fimbriimonadaceae bacterium]
MDTTEALFESWHRQAQMTKNLLSLFDERLIEVKPAEDSVKAAGHFADIHGCRVEWLESASGRKWPELGHLWYSTEDGWDFVSDLAVIRERLEASEKAVDEWVREAIAAGTQKCGPYDHPVLYLQHQLWHEGYHFGMLHLALRQGGAEPEQAWEEANVWGLWRDSE